MTPSAHDSDTDSARTLGESATQWFTVRRPARLVVDGLMVLALAGVLYLGWVMFVEYTRPAVNVEPTRLERNIGYLFSAGYTGAWYLGVVLIAVGCVRFISDAIRSRET
jgi:hypothetical protein